MTDWSCSFADVTHSTFSSQGHALLTANEFLASPEQVIDQACLQKFARITPQYPGVRASLPAQAQEALLCTLSPWLSSTFSPDARSWQMVGWFSIVTDPPHDLLPIQRLPHVDGTDPDQVAMMLYLHRTPHGGTGFFRQRSTGLEALTDDSFPTYKKHLEEDVARTGLPPAAYLEDGSPWFERTHVAGGAFNQAIFYRGNILHSGVIDNDSPLSPDPREGRLTINAFLRPVRAG